MIEASAHTRAAASPLVRPRQGPAYWGRSYVAMLWWHLSSLRMFLAVIVLVQVLLGVGLVLSFGLFFPTRIPARSALYVASGAAVFNLYMVGLVLGPQLVAQQRESHTYEYMQSMAGPRAADALAWYTVTLIVGLPAMVATLVVAGLHYPISLTVSASIVPAALLICAAATLLGSAMAHAIPLPMVTQVVVQVCNFFVIGFAPVCFPRTQLPGWLAGLNDWLPFEHMAVTMRGAVAPALASDVGTSYVDLLGWTIVCAGIYGWAVTKRG